MSNRGGGRGRGRGCSDQRQEQQSGPVSWPALQPSGGRGGPVSVGRGRGNVGTATQVPSVSGGRGRGNVGTGDLTAMQVPSMASVSGGRGRGNVGTGDLTARQVPSVGSVSGGRSRGNVGTGDLTVTQVPSMASVVGGIGRGSVGSGDLRVTQVPSSEASASAMAKLQITEEKKPERNLPPASSKAVKLQPRPGFGTVGEKVMVRANHFLVNISDRDLYHYDVSISPEITSKKVNRDVMKTLVKTYRESHLNQKIPAYDGRKSIYTAGALPFESKEFVVNLKDERADGSFGKERQFKVAIKLAARPDLDQIQQFLNQTQREYPYDAVQVLDVVLRDRPLDEFVSIGRSFFSPNFGKDGTPGSGRGELGEGVEYWRGCFQSLRLTHMGLSLNVDVSARSFYEPILVTDFICKFLNVRDLNRPLRDSDRVKVKKVLKSLKVQLAHWDFKRSTKVSGVSNCPISQLSFTLEDSTQTTVIQYFADKYNYRVKFPALPAIQSGSDAKPTYTPMELCKIAQGQRYTKRLNERQVTSMLRATCQRPQDREFAITSMVGRNKYNSTDLVNKEFGMSVKQELALIEARVLPPPVLKYHESGKEKMANPRLGQWNMINKKMVNGARIDYWTCLNFSTRIDRNKQQAFCNNLMGMCTSKGMLVNPKPVIPLISYRPDSIEEALFDIHKRASGLQLLIVVLPDITGSYGKIKRICETELGIVSQCCQPRQVAKEQNQQYWENVSLKINVKAGGRNTVLNDAIRKRIPIINECPTIILGADVTHPQPGEDSSPSIAAVVASMDWPEITKYRALVSAQAHREEIIQDLYKLVPNQKGGMVHAGMIREHFIAFKNATGETPKRIIFFRDGVSEGQFSQVLIHEMTAIRKACNSLEENYLPPVTFVIVQKRHHTRFFPAQHGNNRMTDRSGNILPGTVVDTKICHPTEFDFYLNSHAGIQGTSRPAHYHVLLDENHFPADLLQILTNNLCYTFARCTRSVSVVPPAYYAHLAAFRARYYMESEMSDGNTSRTRNTTTTNVSQVATRLPEIKANVKDVMFYC